MSSINPFLTNNNNPFNNINTSTPNFSTRSNINPFLQKDDKNSFSTNPINTSNNPALISNSNYNPFLSTNNTSNNNNNSANSNIKNPFSFISNNNINSQNNLHF